MDTRGRSEIGEEVKAMQGGEFQCPASGSLDQMVSDYSQNFAGLKSRDSAVFSYQTLSNLL